MKHEPMATNEIFLGNCDNGISEYLQCLKSIRLGKQAYDIAGDKLKLPYLPVFINKSDAVEHDRIMMQKMKEARN